MAAFVLSFEALDRTMTALAGGKGASLGELSKISGITVPPGFCVTTAAYRRDTDTVPADVARAIEAALARLGEVPVAVRSSATAEDLPTASFAGQHESYLNVRGAAAVLEHVRKCWASLYTERAVAYRRQNGIDDDAVQMAVVVQAMVPAQAAGVLFTADPVSGHRKVTAVDAALGLGEALVSGLVTADHFKLRDGKIIDRKTVAAPVLTDARLLELERVGRTIEAHFGAPQDVEWCLADGRFHIVQSRPITTLYPLPDVRDGEPHVYVSVGHLQMMTDPMKPLGLSFFPITAGRPMVPAGGRLFVDVAALLSATATRKAVIDGFGRTDPLLEDALATIVGRGDFIKLQPDDQPRDKVITATGQRTRAGSDPATVAKLVEACEAAVAALRESMRTKAGPEVFDAILEDLGRQKKFLAENMAVILAPMDAAAWLNEKMAEWLGEKRVADTLAHSVPGNVTAEMGLALLDVADVIRPYPDVVASLRKVKGDPFLDDLARLPGGREARDAITSFLARYGVRCAGEIDLTRPRWIEQPSTLLPLILGNVENFAPGAGKRRFEQGLREASEKERELLARLRALPDGAEKAAETKRMIDVVRNLSGYREYPKYHIVSRYFVYKQALRREGERLAQAGVLAAPEDVDWLTFDELRDAVRTGQVDRSLILSRKDAYRSYEKLTPPRVLTSDGEILNGSYDRASLPPGAIPGLPVSAGVAEGRARVVTSLSAADLRPGDILVTRFTDPSWTPAFVAIKGLVTEVGGLMTHGAVIAREYGLPAVVGVDGATRLIEDGQRIRVHGTDGYVEIL